MLLWPASFGRSQSRALALAERFRAQAQLETVCQKSVGHDSFLKPNTPRLNPPVDTRPTLHFRSLSHVRSRPVTTGLVRIVYSTRLVLRSCREDILSTQSHLDRSCLRICVCRSCPQLSSHTYLCNDVVFSFLNKSAVAFVEFTRHGLKIAQLWQLQRANPF